MMQYRIGRLFAPVPRAVTLCGHSGATGSWLFHSPDLDLFVTGTVNDVRWEIGRDRDGTRSLGL